MNSTRQSDHIWNLPILGLLSIALMSLAPVSSFAGDEIDLGDGVSFLPYGQLSPSYLGFDDGFETYSEFVDNNHSNTRLGFYLNKQLDSGKLSARFEASIGLRQSNSVSQGFVPDVIDWGRKDIRWGDFTYESPRFGKFSLGQGELAAYGVSSAQDFSGTILANYASISDTAGSYRFRDSGGMLTDVSMFAAFPTYDGGRFGRLRYDSPAFGGVTVSTSVGTDILTPETDDLYYDLAARYAGKFDSFQVMGAVGVLRVEPDKGESSTNLLGGFGLLHESGFNLEVTGAYRDAGGHFGYGKLGYMAQWFPVGSTAMAVDYYKGFDTAYEGSETDTWGLGLVQTFEEINLYGYIEYRSYGLSDNTGRSYERANSLLAGVTWTF